MNFEQAVKNMAVYKKSDEAIQAIFDAVEPLCKTSTDGENGESTPLWDWLAETGGYADDDTPANIAQEWDELSQ